MMLSIIIPFCKRLFDSGSVQRLDDAISCFADQPNIEVVVLDTGRHSAQLKLTHRGQENLRYSHQFQPGVFAPGLVRNTAVALATGQYIFLLDADLLISHQLVSQLVSYAQTLASEGPQAFRMFPCLYLSQACSADCAAEFREPARQPALYRKLLTSLLLGEAHQLDGIALVSSCLLINREWFLAIGGFRLEFAGHGYEDFELIHRLTMYYPVGQRPADYSEDVKSQFPGRYRGFRRYFSYYAAPHLFHHEFLLHQWHPRPLSRQYYRQRKINETLFADILRATTVTWPEHLSGFKADTELLTVLKTGVTATDIVLPDFPSWLMAQQALSGYPVNDYPGLFHFQVGVARSNRGIWKKLRKLLLNPKAFIRDSWFIRKINTLF